MEPTVTQLGFGLCGTPMPPTSAETARARRVGAIKALTERPAHPPKKLLKTSAGPASATPLLDQENAARWKWAARLEETGKKAGSFSKLLLETTNESGLSAAEIARLRQLVLSSGAPRTMAVHVSNWKRFAEWAESREIDLHPVASAKLIQYALHLDKNEGGSSVIPTFRTSVKWVTSKLAIDCPDVDHAGLLAIQNEVISKRAKTLKEAVPIPQKWSNVLSSSSWMWVNQKQLGFLFGGGCAWSLLRSGMMMRCMSSHKGGAWQTKVERKRRGTKFVVPHVGFSGVDWLREGWGFLQNGDLNRHFWMRNLNTCEAFRSMPAQYQRSLQWLQHFAKHALNHYHEGTPEEFKVLESKVLQLTAHSARVTMLDAAVHAGRSTEEIGLQANWKNPGPLVLKYTRNRSVIPAKMVLQDMLTQSHPELRSRTTWSSMQLISPPSTKCTSM